MVMAFIASIAVTLTFAAAAQEELPKPFLYDGTFRYEESVSPPRLNPEKLRDETLQEYREVVLNASGEGVADRFFGTWRLISFDVVDDEGQKRERPMRGQITYTRDGLMSAQLMPEREEGGDGSTRPYYAYFGVFQIDPETKTVSHKVEASNIAAWVDTTLVRHYSFDENDRLILTVREDGRDTIVLEWARTELPPEK